MSNNKIDELSSKLKKLEPKDILPIYENMCEDGLDYVQYDKLMHIFFLFFLKDCIHEILKRTNAFK